MKSDAALHEIGVMAMTAQSDPHASAAVYRRALVDICDFALKVQHAHEPAAAAGAAARPEEHPERELLRRFVEKLEVILPKVDSIIGLNTVRSGYQAYDGPNVMDEMREAKALLAADGGAVADGKK